MKYRKIPVVIEAFQYNGSLLDDSGKCLKPDWIEEARNNETLVVEMKGGRRKSGIYIRTLEGEMHVDVGDYIIQGVNGEIYPCKPDIFEKTYVKVEDTYHE